MAQIFKNITVIILLVQVFSFIILIFNAYLSGDILRIPLRLAAVKLLPVSF